MSGTHDVAQLQALRLTAEDIEAQTGFTANRFFIGSLLGGVYRLSAWRQPQYWLRILGIEIIMLAFISMLSMPIGLVALRDPAPRPTQRFIQITTTATTLMFSGWHLYLWHRTRTLRTLMCLLDDIDQYNQLVETVIILKGLTQVNQPAVAPDQTLILAALQASRTSLVTALALETLIRRHQRLFHRSQALWLDLDQALITLKALELQEQAQDYQYVIDQALHISMSVQTTVRQLSLDETPR